MKFLILERYILRSQIGPFLFGTSLVVFLFLLQFVIKFMDQLLGKGLGIWVIVQLIALNISWMLVLAVPIGVLFATLLGFGSLSSTQEVTIMKASGGSLIKMMRPVVLVASVLTYLLFVYNDIVLPEANHQAKVLLSDIKRKKPTFSLESGQFSSDIDGYTILSRRVDSLSGTLHSVTIYDHRSFSSHNIVSADSGIVKFSKDYSRLVLDLYQGEIHQLRPGSMTNYKIIEFDKHLIQMRASGFNFERTDEELMSRSDREMNIADMEDVRAQARDKAGQAKDKIDRELDKHYNYLLGIADTNAADVRERLIFKNDTLKESILQRASRRVSFLRSVVQSDHYQFNEYSKKERKFAVEIYKKYAIPFACLVFVFVGAPIGIITRGGNFGISAAITLGFYILYWACLIGGEKLADRGFLPPMFAMWMANIIVGFLGAILTIKVNNENANIPGLKYILNAYYWVKSLFAKK